MRKRSANQVRQFLSQLQELGYGVLESVGKRFKFFPRKNADAADTLLTQVLTPNQATGMQLEQEVQAFSLSTADTADTTQLMGWRSREIQNEVTLNTGVQVGALTLERDEPQSVSSVSTLDESFAEQGVEGADNLSAVASAPSAVLMPGDRVVLMGDANLRCPGQELTAIWSVRRVVGDQVIVMCDPLGKRRYPLTWLALYSRG